ncbi:acyl-coenzyme A diphosphatase NUDT19-like [Anopheles ziemanni]|uniref:acyl-coenzyme A diphosphatase NUDT19-like n=1 Tax=Anopheles coustani TaxID=139045 RepID=UPI002657E28C|nr:acyl-coenzyme A diphosphatase NUDT19-like [Anopheles coustani]XP_058167215.1 acyl-coenzyme A diphosphatase NUDT19-like [Anopheles ziemanni]
MMRKFAKYWRDSATLVVLARNKPATTNEKYNYKVLTFKRTEKTSFMPSSVVFPGGGFDRQDGALEWTNFFEQRGVNTDRLKSLTQVTGPRPYIFQTESDDQVDRNISLRLCALREAFEELGILLAGPVDELDARTDGYSQCLKSLDVPSWQRRIHDGAASFRELHSELGVVPDIFSLYEWSCWLTPTMFRKRRFETAFYLAVLNEIPSVHPEEHEVAEYLWDTPAALLEAHRAEKLWLAPPQMYELTRLSHLYDIDQIVRFAIERNRKGSTVLCPVQYTVSDGVVFVLPGDDLYPANYDFISKHSDVDKYSEITREELRSKAKRLHRVEHLGLHHQEYFLNQMPLDGHLNLTGDNGHLVGL